MRYWLVALVLAFAAAGLLVPAEGGPEGAPKSRPASRSAPSRPAAARVLYRAFVPQAGEPEGRGKWGFIDRSGKMVIEPQFGGAGLFLDGLACVRGGGLGVAWGPRYGRGDWGYTDAEGKIVIPPKYDEASDFQEGFARVWPAQEGAYRYLDRAGREVKAELTGEDGVLGLLGASSFSEGLAAAAPFDRWGYIDSSGRWAIKARFAYAFAFREGLGCVNVGGSPRCKGYIGLWVRGGKWGFIDKSGVFVIKPAFDAARPFSEGLAQVNVGGKGANWTALGGKWGYVDRKGHVAIKPRFVWAKSFSEGLAAVCTEGSNERGRPKEKDAKWGFIDKTGRVVIEPVYSVALSFSEGLAFVKPAGKEGPRTRPGASACGFIDPTGKMVIPPEYEAGSSFWKGLAWVREAGSWRYIDKTGKTVWAPPRP